METPEELIEKCKAHLRDNTTPTQWYKTDIRKLITALERALSIANVVGQREQLPCRCCGGKKNDNRVCINGNCSSHPL